MRKGISQVLTIIVTALVLLTAALAVVAAVLGGLDDSTSTLDTQTCISAVQSQCRPGLTDQVVAPEPCLDQQGSVPQSMENQVTAASSVADFQDGNFVCAGADAS